MPFKYVPRSAEDLSKRENQRGSSYIGVIADEFRNYKVGKENWLRFVPPTWEGARHYGLDVWVHYDVGPNGATVLCLASMESKPCPLCELGAIAEAKGEENNFFAVKRVLVWVVDRKDGKDQKANIPEAWLSPWTLDRDISKLCRDRQTGELYYIDDPENGYNVSFDRSDPPNSKYTGIQVDKRPSPLDQKFIDYAIAHPLPDILVKRSYAEIKALYEGDAGAEEPKKLDPEPETPRVTLVSKEPFTTPAIPKPGEAELCSNGITSKGVRYLCGLSKGHTDPECDYSREIATVAPTPAPSPAISSRAAELRARLDASKAGRA